MYHDFILSLSAYSESGWVLIKYRLWKYIFLLLFLLLIFIGPVFLFDYLLQFITGLIPYGNPEKYATMGVSIFASISGFLLLLVLSPVFSMISEEVTQQMAGKVYRFSLVQLLKDIIRGLRITLRNLAYEYLVIALVSLLLYLLPEWKPFEIIGTVLIILFTTYFYGFSILDYAMENHRMNYQQSVDYVRSHPGIAIGLGSLYYLVISINDLPYLQDFLGHLGIYWSAFAEAIIAFFGVIAGSVLLSRKLKTTSNEKLKI